MHSRTRFLGITAAVIVAIPIAVAAAPAMEEVTIDAA